MPAAEVLIDSVVLTLYCSNEAGERQFGGLHERKVARAGDLHRIGRRGVGGQPLLRKHGVHRETAHGAAEAGGSARWQRLDGDVDARTLHLAGHVDEVGTAPEEGIHVAASRHHDLRHGRQFGRLDHERPGLLRVEQVLLGHERLIDLAVEGLALAPGIVGIESPCAQNPLNDGNFAAVVSPRPAPARTA